MTCRKKFEEDHICFRPVGRTLGDTLPWQRPASGTTGLPVRQCGDCHCQCHEGCGRRRLVGARGLPRTQVGGTGSTRGCASLSLPLLCVGNVTHKCQADPKLKDGCPGWDWWAGRSLGDGIFPLKDRLLRTGSDLEFSLFSPVHEKKCRIRNHRSKKVPSRMRAGLLFPTVGLGAGFFFC